MKKHEKSVLGNALFFMYVCVYSYSERTKCYDFVITAARHYWNTVKPLVNEPLERQLLKESLQTVLQSLATVSEKNIDKNEEVCIHTCLTPFMFSIYFNIFQVHSFVARMKTKKTRNGLGLLSRKARKKERS